MKITLLGHTEITPAVYDQLNISPWSAESPGDLLSEFAGRSCYQSWHKPNPATATNDGYLANVLSQHHFSVFEHNAYTFYFEGISRALTHELIRHRHLSYSQLSQRFVDETGRAEAVLPPAFADSSSRGRLEALAAYVQHITTEAYREAAHILERGDGLTRKQAREAARAFLPNMQETKIVVTGNVRAWREFLAKRNNEHADAEIQRAAQNVYEQLARLVPNSMLEIGDR